MAADILRFDDVSAVSGHAPLSFGVAPGRCLGLFSASAPAVSRLLLTAAGLAKPFSGRVTIAGIDIVRDAEAARRQAAITRPSCIDGRLRLHEYLHTVAQARRSAGTACRDSVATVIERLALDRSRRLSSPAARAEAALAAALMPSVSLLLLDAPFPDLSAETRARAIDWIRALAGETVAIVIGGSAEGDLRAVSHTVVSAGPRR